MNLMNTCPRQGQAGFRGDLLAIQRTVVFLDAGYGGNPISDHARSGSPGKRKAPLKSPSRPKMGRLAPSPFALA